MKTHLLNRPLSAYVPLNCPINFTSKTHFFHKSPNQSDSFINMNHSMAQRSPSSLKINKKYSFEVKNTRTLSSNTMDSLKIMPSQKTVPKSKSTNDIQKQFPENQTRKNTRRVVLHRTEQEIKLFQWRSATHFPLVKISCLGSKQVGGANPYKEPISELELEIRWEEDVKFNLIEIDQFSLLNSLYIIEESLVSFQRLYHKFGYFEPNIKMIFITNAHKCKIWANENIWENFPCPARFVLKEHQKIENFYTKVIAMFSRYFKAKTQVSSQPDVVRRTVNLIDKLIYELQRKNDFIQGMKFIKQFVQAYSLKINNRFIYPLDISETRSRIFSKPEKPQTNKGGSMVEIPIKEETVEQEEVQPEEEVLVKGEEEQNSEEQQVKTRKNSYRNCSKEVMESNVKTIILEKKSQHKEKEIPFKKKSQISICSKQTIVEKKSRFSMYDEKDGKQPVNPINSRHLPNFTQEDFNEDDDETHQAQIPTPESSTEQQIKETGPTSNVLGSINDDQEYEDKVRIEIEKNVRERNGWLTNPQLLFDTDDCAKSIQDSQPSIKMKIRERNLSKLNRIKTSITHSIND